MIVVTMDPVHRSVLSEKNLSGNYRGKRGNLANPVDTSKALYTNGLFTKSKKQEVGVYI